MDSLGESKRIDLNSIVGERSGLDFLGGLVKTHFVVANLEKMGIIATLSDRSRVVVWESGAGFEPWYFAKRGVKQVVAVDDQRSQKSQFQAQDFFLKDQRITFERKTIQDWLRQQSPGSADLIYVSNVEPGSIFPTISREYSSSNSLSLDISNVLGSAGSLVYEEEAHRIPTEIDAQPFLSWQWVDPSRLDISLPLPGYIKQIQSGYIDADSIRGINLQGTIIMRAQSLARSI